MDFPGKYEISSLKIIKNLHSSRPTSYDIRTLMAGLNIYESLFDYTLSGNITLIDTNNLITNIPILGYEHLQVSFKDSLSKELIIKFFKIYKIENIKKASEKSKSYKINFASEEALINSNYRISKKYIGTKSSIIKDVLSTITDKKVEIDTDFDQYNILFPRWKPFKCISFLSNFTKNSTGDADYLFWENLFGFRYKSLKDLYSKKVKHSLMTNIGTIRDNQTDIYNEASYQAINDMIIPNDINDLDNLLNGVYGATTYTYDYLTGTTSKNIFKQEDEDSENNLIYNHQDSTYKYELIANRNSLFRQLKNNTLYINTPGNQERTCGDTIQVSIMSPESDNKLDAKLSGKYVISSICHNFSAYKYTQNIGLIK